MRLTRRSLLGAIPTGAYAGPEQAAALWAAQFTQPDGQALSPADWRGRWLVVNFWATWCPPCVIELPDFDRFHQEEQAKGKKGWQVLGLAIDGPTPVRDFLKHRPLRFPIGLAGLNGSELMRKLGNLRGGLPFTVVINPQGLIVWRRPGETRLAWLQEQRQKLGGD